MEPSEQAIALARVEEIVTMVRAIEKMIKFPVRNSKQLADALGGEEAQITYEGILWKVEHLRRVISAEYFPIDSPEELIAKIVDLRARAEPGWPGQVNGGTELKEVPVDAGVATAPADYKHGNAHGKGPTVKGWR